MEHRRRGEFCSRAHKGAWANRNAVRGAKLYQLFMASRFDLTAARDLKVWREMNRLASSWRAEDEAAGRKSWHPPKRTIARLADNGDLARGVITYHRAGR